MAMARKKRINMELGPRHEMELEWIMNNRGLIDRTNTMRAIITEIYNRDRRDEPKGDKGKPA